MEQRARNELIKVICGLVMIVVGLILFMSKARITSDFLDGEWEIWKMILALVPLVAGIVMMIVKPNLLASKLVALAGAVVVVLILFFTTTIVVEKDIAVIEWILYMFLIFGGLIISAVALLVNGKKNK